MPDYILPLGSIGATSLTSGGKASNLSALAQANFPVPEGFIITTASYRAFVNKNRLQGMIETLINNASGKWEIYAEEIRRLFLSATIPEDITREILFHYRELAPKKHSQEKFAGVAFSRSERAPAVAVRSSSTEEDCPALSFAGLHDTFLKIRGERVLLNTIKKCWSGLWTPRALIYRQYHDLDWSSASMGVLVQRYIQAEKSGVLFTAHPLTGDDTEITINAAWGLGDSVVGGKCLSEHIVVKKHSGKIIREDATDMTGSADPLLCAPGKPPCPVLERSEIKALTHFGQLAETHFGKPQDMEWAIVANNIFILQSRPVTRTAFLQKINQRTEITSVDDYPIKTSGNRPAQTFDVWTRANVGEIWRDPVSPIVASVAPQIVGAMVKHSFEGIDPAILDHIRWVRCFNGRVYYNEGALRYLLSSQLGLPATFIDRARGNFQRDAADGRNKFHIFRVLRHLSVLYRMMKKQQRLGRRLQEEIVEIDASVSDFLNRSEDDSRDKELWDNTMQWTERAQYALNLQNDISGYAQISFSLLEKLTNRWLGSRELALVLSSGQTEIQAAEIGDMLWQMSEKIKSLGLASIVAGKDNRSALEQIRRTQHAKPFLELLDVFLREHGHRCPNEGEWLHPRWMDAPEQVMALIRGFLKHGSSHLTRHEAQQKRNEALREAEKRLNIFQRAILRAIIRRVQRGILLRDNGKSYAMKAMYPARKLVIALGNRWMQHGWLEKPEDICFLTVDEIRQIADAGTPAVLDTELNAIISGRQRAFQYWFGVDAPDELGSDGKPLVPALNKAPSGTSNLQGIPAGPGRVRGRVRILFDPYEAVHLKPGEILVTRSTDVGWSTVFPLIAGLVTEVGGQLSHAAILAREYHLPLIVSVPEACSRLREGQFITMDCSNGMIFPE